MKQKYIRRSLFILVVILAAACTKRDDYKKYQVNGEISYPGIMDSVKVMAGKNRVLVTGLFTSDPKITMYRMFWNSRQDSIEVPVVRKGDVDTTRTILSNLVEGAVTVEIRTYDAKGNRSIPVFTVGNAYGVQYESAINNRSATAMTVTKAGLNITWAAIATNSPFTRLTYASTDGSTKMIRVPGANVNTLVADYRYGTKILVHSGYLPEPTAIDTFFATKPDTLKKENALAGVYVSGGLRTNYTGAVANNVVAGTTVLSGDKTSTELSADKIEVDYANLGGSGWKYVFTYDGTTISVAPNATMMAGIAPGSFIIQGLTFNRATGIIDVKTVYTNTTGDARKVEETLTMK
ncbi:DUF4998 domain-containing protein [Chitinophaga niabensis]|uniref:DUF5013 domain-containing protein n=1 Tax=Chitinophaga niabensis TaxID=536979 RepID=A0A1N6D139_9BACT|nr:DUF4998 domain-containing protein [Chitinophaga niabensis]SIN64416.1 protein of unknown function [Chitinophaga niabensis]